MNREAFFAAIRPAFGNRLSGPQVAGMEAIFDACADAKVTNVQHVAHVMAHVRRETGGYMSPIKETVMPSHKDKKPSDAEVMQRLERAFARGKLPWVKKPYWRDGAFGRGPVQITHWSNYEKIGRAIGVDLRGNPDLAMDPVIGGKIAVIGMRDGLFTGKKLADYRFPAALDAAPKSNPRRIVNGVDGSDAEVAKFHRQFHAALIKAGWSEASAKKPAAARSRAESATSAKPAAPMLTVSTKGRGGLIPVVVGLIVGGYATVAAWWNENLQPVIDWLVFWQ
jgi:hypothetical protein